MEILKKDNNVNRIYFLSDIHIKNDASHNDKYYSVFDNLFKFYKKEKVNQDDVIVITGDIMDNGYAVSGNAIEMAKKVYINLSNFCPVISILGNHDLKTNVDTLTPIVKEHLKTKHELHFLLDDKIYLYGQIAFGHTKMGSAEVINCKKYNKDYVTISLYHGMLKGAKLDNGIECRDNLLISQFKDYKYCAFGDIHKMQYLRKDKTAFYTGSLIAQKISEDAFEHGTMKLDLNKEKIEFIEIQNDYKKINLIIDDDGNVSNYDLNKILKSTKFADLQLTFGNCGEKNIDNLKKKFEDNQIVITNFLQRPQIENLTFDTILKIDDKEIKLSSVVDKKSCSEFLLTYIDSKHKIDNKERFNKNLSLLMNEINFEDIMKKKRNLQFIEIEINNIMVYGKDVKLDIDKFNGIVGICENNSSGKSTLCEIISLILFGKTPRCGNGFSFVRNEQKECSCILRIISNGIEYEIKRMFVVHCDNDKKVNTVFAIKKYINKKKSQSNIYVKNDTNSKKVYKNEDVIFKSDSEMKDIINNEILTYDELYQMIVISQNREKSFLEEKDKDKLLFKITNLSYLKEISDKIDDLYKETKRSIKSMLISHCAKEFTSGYKKDFTPIQSYEHSKNILDKFEKEIKEYDENKKNKNKELYDKYQNKNNELISLKERIKMYDEFKNIDDEYDVDELNEENIDINKDIDKINNEIKDYDINIKTNETNINKIKKELKKYDDIDKKYDEFNEKQQEIISKLKKDILSINKNIKDIHYKNITKQEYTKYNKEDIIINKEIQELKDKLIFYKEENNKINTIGSIKNIIIEYDKYNDLFNQKNKLENEINFIKNYDIYLKSDINTKKKLKNIINELNENIENINKNIIDIEHIKKSYNLLKIDKDHDKIILDLEKDINNKNKQLEILKNKINDYTQQQQNIKYNKEISDLEEQLNKEEDKEYDDYNIHCDLTKNLQKYEKQLSDIKYKRETLLNKLNKKEVDLKENKDILLVINKNKDNYNKYCKIKKQLDNIKKEYLKIEKEYNESNDLIQKDDKKINDVKEKYIIAKDIIKKSKDTIDNLKDFELLVNILKTNGLCDKLLEEQIIVNLQKALNEICTYIGHEKIYVDFIHTPENESKKFNIIIRTDKIKDISNAGGFQTNIIELIFKVALLRINSYLKSDFIIIDELFDACSEDNKSMAIKLVEYYKTQYNKMLLVSHNQSIINLFDKRLIINHDNINGNNII
jgi:exonuclease SbcC